MSHNINVRCTHIQHKSAMSWEEKSNILRANIDLGLEMGWIVVIGQIELDLWIRLDWTDWIRLVSLVWTSLTGRCICELDWTGQIGHGRVLSLPGEILTSLETHTPPLRNLNEDGFEVSQPNPFNSLYFRWITSPGGTMMENYIESLDCDECCLSPAEQVEWMTKRG